jgi:protein-S-isoprenylcysteine O-methyltransferase Ste14
MQPSGKASSRFVWPPAIYATATLIAGLLTWLSPMTFLPAADRLLALGFGIAAIVSGAGLIFAAGRGFRRAGTPVAPTRPSTAVVTSGIYRWTRNPMYLGMSLVLGGIGLATGSLWFLMALPVAIIAVTKLAIEREERYLAEVFGAPYLDYKTRVRRWF